MSSRPEVIPGGTYKIKAVIADGVVVKIYVTLNYLDDKCYEIFAHTNNAKLWEHMAAVTLMISRLLQAGVTPERIAQDLNQIHSPVTGHMAPGGYAPSIYARLGSVLVRESAKAMQVQSA